ncbi:DUF1642 domain-containing protein, partial [Lactococcus cremoris]
LRAWDKQDERMSYGEVEYFDDSINYRFDHFCTGADEDVEFMQSTLWVKNNPEKYIIARNIGYTVEKPQLFYIDLPKVFELSDSTSDSTFVSKAESGIISEFTKGKDYALKLTEQEIKSIDERYWQFAVPVEDGE